MTAVNPTPYDEIIYPNYVYSQTHPDRLATIAILLGMTPAPVTNCRVLEMGCGGGGNIVPMAFQFPESEFLGVDLAASTIAKGRETITALGLKNISLQALDLMALPDEIGEFDYIIAHGLFSWVPEVVRDRILAICRSHLSPQGVAYISYNSYPGCRLREIARDMMIFHVKDIKNPREHVGQGRALIKWVAEAQSQSNSYANLLRELNSQYATRHDGSLFHDELGETNVPFYFYQFAGLAARHGLRFVSEADYFEAGAYYNLPEEVAQQLEKLGEEDILAKEQYLDFLKGRSFRQTLLCHREVKLQRPINPERINGLLIRSQAQPVSSTPDLKSRSIEEFTTRNQGRAATDLPLVKAALRHLGAVYPRAIQFDELLQNARALSGADQSVSTPDEDGRALGEAIIKIYGAGVIELHLHQSHFAIEPGEFPIASPLARLQAREGNIVSTLLHHSLKLEDNLALQLLSLLDGKHGREELINEISVTVRSNYAKLPPDEQALSEDALLESIPKQLDEKLMELGKLGLLLA